MLNYAGTEALDTLERRFTRIYPLARLSRYSTQTLATFAALNLTILFCANVVELILLATGFRNSSAGLAVATTEGLMMGSLQGLLSVNCVFFLLLPIAQAWKPSAILWILTTIVVIFYNVPLLWSYNGVILDRLEIAGLPSLFQLAVGIFLLFISVYYVWIIPVGWVRGAFAALTISAQDRAIVREIPGTRAWPDMLSALFGFSPLMSFARGDKLRWAAAVALSIMSTFFLTITSIVSQWSPLLYIYFGSLAAIRSPGMTLVVLVGAPAAIGAVILIAAVIGRIIERAEFRLIRFSLQEMQRQDQRPPVLFLRAFADDQVELPKPKLPHLAFALEIARRRTNLDELLLHECTPYGPVVALGNPTDKYPPYGAARGYFQNKNWHQAVEDLARISSFVVMCVDRTDGILWEAEHIAAANHIPKTLFLIHPTHRQPAANRAVLAELIPALGLKENTLQLSVPPLIPGQKRSKKRESTVIGFFIGDDNQPTVIRSATFSHFAYLLAIRRFIRGKFGTPPDLANAGAGLPGSAGVSSPEPPHTVARRKVLWCSMAAIFTTFFCSNFGISSGLFGVRLALGVTSAGNVMDDLGDAYHRMMPHAFFWDRVAAVAGGLITLVGSSVLTRTAWETNRAMTVAIIAGIVFGLLGSFLASYVAAGRM